jgi:hypothetical protein
MPNRALQTLKILCSILLLCLGGTRAAAADEPLTPEAVTDLYLRVFINQEVSSAHALNDYLRPRYQQRDALDVEALMKMHEEIIAGAQVAFAQNPSALPFTPELRVAFTAALRAQLAAVKRSACQATAHERLTAEGEAGGFLARVRYTCLVPAIEATLPELSGAKDAEYRVALLAQALRDYADAARGAPVTREISGEFTLHAEKGETPRWAGASPESPLELVMAAVYPEAMEHIFR